MVGAFDRRIVKVGIVIDGEETIYEGLDIRAQGTKFLGLTYDQCEVKISNLTKEHRNYILTTASIFNIPGRDRKPVLINLYVGRESYGTFLLFTGYCFYSQVTPPPDIGITLRSITSGIQTGLVQPYDALATSSLRSICQTLANDWKSPDGKSLTLDFQATEKNIQNWSGTSAVTQRLEKLNAIGGIVATVDNNTLLVLDASKPRKGATILIDAQGGMVGIPQVNEAGVTVRCMLNNSIQLGTKVKVISEINPAANGDFYVKQLNFDIANREDPFYYSMLCGFLF